MESQIPTKSQERECRDLEWDSTFVSPCNVLQDSKKLGLIPGKLMIMSPMVNDLHEKEPGTFLGGGIFPQTCTLLLRNEMTPLHYKHCF